MREGRLSGGSVSTVVGVVPKVSVCMVTYNHEKFIGQAIESVLAQQTLFPIELVIGEDCSTDDTRRIVSEYQRRHPDVIRVLLNERNLGGHDNFIQTYGACRGEYIVLLEGDDYWTSPDKLQTQAEFLDAHGNYVACFHNVEVRYEDGSPGHPFHRVAVQPRLALIDIISDFRIPPLSVMFRAGIVRDFPHWYRSMPMGDWPLHILLAHHGDYAYHDTVMGVYRRHAGGVWSSMRRRDNLLVCVKAIDIVRRNIDGRYQPTLYALRAALLNEAMQISLRERNVLRAVIDGVRSYRSQQQAENGRSFPLRHLVRTLRKGLRQSEGMNTSAVDGRQA